MKQRQLDKLLAEERAKAIKEFIDWFDEETDYSVVKGEESWDYWEAVYSLEKIAEEFIKHIAEQMKEVE